MAIVGIDLGTSNSLVGVWTGAGPELIENALGETLTPSAVSIADDGIILVGRAASDRLISHPDRSVASFKRWMGSTHKIKLADKVWRPEELSALILKSLKEDAETKLGKTVDEAVISVPAYFNDPQRKATLDAARLAGLKVERLVNEPTAASLAHGLEVEDEGRFLVLDLGGGTFDVSLLHKYEGVMEIRASAGDSMLGGNDFRDVLMELLAKQHDFNRAKLKPLDLARLQRQAEEIKCGLSEQPEITYDFSLSGKNCEGRLTRANFEEAAQSLLKRIRAPIERAVRDARLDPSKVDRIILVGGATRMPMIRNLAARLFGRFPLIHPHPDHVVALGATVQVGLKHRHGALDEFIMTDVCPFTLGTSVLDPRAPDNLVMSPIIERNTIVPISREHRYYTVADNQTELHVDVLQGENIHPAHNIQIGVIKLSVPPGPAGSESIDIRYTYDINGALEVEVKVTSTDKVHRKVFRNQANLSNEELDQRFKSLAAIKLAPRDQQENRALLARAERLYAEALGPVRDHIAQLILEFEFALKRHADASIVDIRKDFADTLDQFERSVF